MFKPCDDDYDLPSFLPPCHAWFLLLLIRCQTYEGGFGGEPGNEAHGGYAFCAFAALVILGRHYDADMDALEVRPNQYYYIYHFFLLLLPLHLLLHLLLRSPMGDSTT